ncbi:hypothetical protein SynA18461_01786 [Synechococcus sp. A18-46.1]|nr:hypothetical protein SynA18461_01786 [Synechococcus sp. A18-46.1]
MLIAPACCNVNTATSFGDTTFLAKNGDEHGVQGDELL